MSVAAVLVAITVASGVFLVDAQTAEPTTGPPVPTTAPTSTSPTVIVDYFAPLCASDGKTYLTDDAFVAALKANSSLTRVSSGACPTPTPIPTTTPVRTTPVPITTKVLYDWFAPLCGSDGKTYLTDAAFDAAIKANSTLRRASSGPCPTPLPTVPRWGQCGGLTYTGPTGCIEGTCTKWNDWYSQCV